MTLPLSGVTPVGSLVMGTNAFFSKTKYYIIGNAK